MNEQSYLYPCSFQRSSFAEQHERQLVFEPPARKFVRVVRDSLVEGKEELYRDAGLAFGRSFRVGWGPGGALVHLGAICGPYDQMLVDINGFAYF